MQPRISISNFFLMLVYAWSHYRPEQLKLFGVADYDKPVDFLFGLLCEVVHETVVHNLAQRHSLNSERLKTVRGKIEIEKSLLSPDWKAGVVVCRHPVVDVDTLENQLIKATLRQVSSYSGVGNAPRIEARKIYTKLSDVSDIVPSKSAFRRSQLDRSMRRYRFPLAICELLLNHEMAEDSTGKAWFASYIRDEIAMRKLFESFVRAFLKQKLKSCAKVGGRKLSPFMLSIQKGNSSFIPSMLTDVTVQNTKQVLVIDTKYTPNTLQNSFGNQTIRSEHFYQIQAYTRHTSRSNTEHGTTGMVLYPKAEIDLDLQFSADDCKFVFCTLDLSKDWREVEADLLSLVQNCIK